MGKINCRGHENRLNLCERYDIKAELRMKMISGIIKSDTGAIVSDELYIFSAYKKSDGSFYDKIMCGEKAAKDFLVITGQNRPPLFNILKSPHPAVSGEKPCSTSHKSQKAPVNPIFHASTEKIDWHPVNKSLYEAIVTMIVVWQDTEGDSILFKEMRKCLKYPDKYPFSDRLMRINSIIGKDRRKTLFNILESLKKAGNDIRDFDLQLLHEAVEKTGVKSNIM